MTDATRVVVPRREETPYDLTIQTPPQLPNVEVEVMPALVLILVRTARTGLQVFVAALIGGAAGPSVPIISDALPPAEFQERMLMALYLAAIAALIAAAQNGAELLAKLDTQHPELRG